MEIKKVTDAAFRKYGRVVDNVDFTALVAELEKTPCTQEVVYEPSVEQLEALPVYKELQDTAYGEMPIQRKKQKQPNRNLRRRKALLLPPKPQPIQQATFRQTMNIFT